MKFSQVKRGTRAVKAVKFRLANAPIEDETAEVTIGVRVMTGEEQRLVFERAQAAIKGIDKWDPEHPLCKLHQMAETLALACVDIDDKDNLFFKDSDEVLKSPELGTDNMVLLFEEQDRWQDECSFRDQKLSAEQMISIIVEEAERPENAESPFSRLRPGLAASCIRFMASMCLASARASSLTSSISDTSSSETTRSEIEGDGGGQVLQS